ncbi:cytochrome P450 [Auricularia subglabra TFB-10046 SS5]|nr:cytochrome P450 [Auricularia subglabra TFB-10046 SS5]
MAPPNSYALIAWARACGTVLFLALRRRRAALAPLPPGPPAHILLGNTADLPATNQWEEFTRLATKYGPVVHLRLLYKRIIVLNTLEAVTELLDRRGGIYSDRPRFPMIVDLMGWGWITTFIPYGPAWRESRRVLHHFFHEGAALKHREAQTLMNLRFLRLILDSPEDFMQHIRTLAGSSILGLTYGIDVKADGDPWVKLGVGSIEIMSMALVFGTYAVDWLPILKYIPAWFPGASFQALARESRAMSDRVQRAPQQWLKDRMQEGKIGSSLAEILSQNGLDGRPVTEEVAAATLATAYLGGSDTSVSLICSFVLCMVLHPEKQKAAREEIDRVLGRGIMPTFADRDSLPYVSAILLEVIRLYPVLPLGVSHRVMEDDEYNGMRIPKGTTILANVWSILRDKRYYDDPEEFKPERYLKNGVIDLKNTVPDPRGPLFGFGRRICPGRHFAEATAWLSMATMLACFEITCAEDSDGNQIVPNPNLTTGAVTCVEPFPCEIRPRFEGTERMLLDATETMKDSA